MPVSMIAILMSSPRNPAAPFHTDGAPISGTPRALSGFINWTAWTATTPGTSLSAGIPVGGIRTLIPLYADW